MPRARWAPGRWTGSSPSPCRLMAPGIAAGADDRVRGGARRVRRGHHLRRQHPRRDPDPAARDLRRAASARRRGDRGAAVDRVVRPGPHRAVRVGAHRPPRPYRRRDRRACCRIDIAEQLGAFTLAASFEAPARGAPSCSALRAREEPPAGRHRRPGRARQRPHRARRRDSFRFAPAASMSPPRAAASASCSRKRACSRT